MATFVIEIKGKDLTVITDVETEKEALDVYQKIVRKLSGELFLCKKVDHTIYLKPRNIYEGGFCGNICY